jgi:hypothetical protein
MYRQATDGSPYAYMQIYNNATGYSSNISSGTSVADSVWHHHVLQHNATTNTFNYYIDGVSKGSNTAYSGSPSDFSIDMYYGQQNQSTEAPNQFFDSARFSNVIRYSSNFTAPTSEFSPTNTVITANASSSVESTSNTATATPTKANLIITYQNATGTATVNTDVIGYVSRDGGTTYTPVTFVNAGTLGSNIVLAANDISLSSQPSGTSMKWKVAFANQSGSKQTRLYGVSLSWN